MANYCLIALRMCLSRVGAIRPEIYANDKSELAGPEPGARSPRARAQAAILSKGYSCTRTALRVSTAISLFELDCGSARSLIHTVRKSVVRATNVLINDFTSSVPNPVALDHNLYFATVGAASSSWDWQGKFITGYSNYQAASGQDAHSPFADPQFDNIATLPPNLAVSSTSPAVNEGTNLGSTVVGILDFAGSPRVNASRQINAGAYEQ